MVNARLNLTVAKAGLSNNDRRINSLHCQLLTLLYIRFFKMHCQILENSDFECEKCHFTKILLPIFTLFTVLFLHPF